MASTKRRLGEKMQKQDAKFSELTTHIYRNIGPRPKIRSKHQEFREQLLDCRSHYLAIQKKIKEATISNRDHFVDYMSIHVAKTLSILDTLDARVQLQTVRPYHCQENFTLQLQAAGMSPRDLDHAVEEHHKNVEAYFSMEDLDLPEAFVQANERTLYEDIARKHKTQLDELASRIFRRSIHTKLDVNVKEQNPHQWLGWVNIGYENRLPKLVATIAHEGPFGHQTHQTLSEDYIFNNNSFTLTLEGLAVLGETIALNQYFGGNEQAQAISQFEHISRRINDSLYAAIAKLAYFERKSASEMAEILKSDYYPEKFLENGLANFDNDRLRMFTQPSSVSYFVGFNKINGIYQKAKNCIMNNPKIKNEDEQRLYYSNLLKTMYRGIRTPEVMNMEVDLFLKRSHLDNCKAPEPPSTYEKDLKA